MINNMRDEQEIKDMLAKVIDSDRAYDSGTRESIIRQTLDWVLGDDDEEPYIP